MSQPPAADDTRIWDMWLSAFWQPSVLAALDCGVFEALDDAPADAEALAGRLGLEARALSIVMSLVAALDFVAVREGRYHLSPAGRAFLVSGGPHSWTPILSTPAARSDLVPQIAAKLKGEAAPPPPTAGEDRLPVEGWEQADVRAEEARGIAAFMHTHSVGPAVGAERVLDLSGVKRLLDVGGGSGCFAVAFAQRWPDLRCTVMELAEMCVAAEDYIAAGGVMDRVDTRAVDMFRQDWPDGYDAMFFSNIFHDWSEDTCRDLAARAFAALAPGGRILLHEQVLADDKAGPLTTAAFSVMMLLGTRGRQYSLPELRAMLEEAGFTDISLTPTYGYYSVVAGRKPA